MKEDVLAKFCDLLGKHKQFKIRLPRYDGGSHFFWPYYLPTERLFVYGTVVVAVWDNKLIVGTVNGKVPSTGNIGLSLINPSEDTKTFLRLISIPKENIVAVLMPE